MSKGPWKKKTEDERAAEIEVARDNALIASRNAILMADDDPGAGQPFVMTDIIHSAETAVLPREPYRAEEISFSPRPGDLSLGQLITRYLNSFKTETGAELMLCHATTSNTTFLFIWGMKC